ncbi:DUF7336 domain-containing protein [Ectopseudomonas khazarica]
MKNVHVVQHMHILPSGEESVLFIGVYSSYDAAEAAIKRLSMQPGFCKYPEIIDPDITDQEQGFYIDLYELDKDHWSSGYVTMAGDSEHKA